MCLFSIYTQRQARKLLATGKVSSYAKAEMVVQLVTLYYDEDDASLAVEATDTFEAAEAYLQQECELCAGAMKAKHVSQKHILHV